ncbi:hypothetical protein CARUB_v10002552mg [Capsella rubella]|uniref:DUF4378 domain-containing protein n=1 Tax=Capsella rubella TaxID=81985 RepID=R0FCN1_9BRAS|nr:uncharacterized protein LOC17883899 [Capsella rubella]EOA19551.1 hypothetical protein CARUB_v10002552mg [Capsella rubella]
MELRPRKLKDCLLEDSNSCSSNGFKSMPRRPPLNPFTIIPKRKQSNALQAVINAVKSLRSNAVKSSPSRILPRTLSRRLTSKKKVENQASITVVRVKDIVRWSSSKDLHEDISHFELFPPHQYTTKTTTTATGSSTTTSTSCSSWCDSDFTSEFLPSSWGSNVEECGEKESVKNNLHCVGEDSCTAVTVADTEVGPEEDLQCEKEHNSPVSVFEIQHEEYDEASDSSFSQCLDNVEKTKQKLMQTIQRFETLANISPFTLDEWASRDEESCMDRGEVTEIRYDDGENCDTVDGETEDEDADEIEEKAGQLWNRVKERHAIWIHEEHLIMDYFRDELVQRKNSFHETQHFEDQLVSEAKGWLQGQRESELESGTGEQRRQACAREIERRGWNEKRMKEEQEEVAVQIEDGLFSLLMNETITALYQC